MESQTLDGGCRGAGLDFVLLARPQLIRVKRTEHLCPGGQEKVAKIVQCGEPRIDEGRWKQFQRSFHFESSIRRLDSSSENESQYFTRFKTSTRLLIRVWRPDLEFGDIN